MPNATPMHADEYLRRAREQVRDADEITNEAFEAHLPKGPMAGDVNMATLLYRAAEMNLKLYDLYKARERRAGQ